MTRDNKIEEHIARTIFGSMLMIVFIFVILFNEENQIITKTKQIFGYQIHELIYWVLIIVIFLIFFTYVLPSIVFLVKKILQSNDD